MTDLETRPTGRGIDRTKAPDPVLSGRPVTGDRYSSVEFMKLEWEHMWTKVWLTAGLESQIPEPDDYFRYDIGSESIICVRGDDMGIRAFYNTCQHRGNQLVVAEAGNLPGGAFQCPYHGWRFDTEGTLVFVHDADDFPQGNPCGKLNLVEIPCDTWAGFVWINMDPDCIPLAEYLQPVAEQLDTYRMQDMVRTHWITLEGDWNWKCVQDNFNESYHLPYVHPQLANHLTESASECQFDMYPSGHARMFMPGGGPAEDYSGDPEKALRAMGETLAFWDLDPETFRDNPGAMRVALQQRKRELGASKGYDFSNYTDEQLTDNYHYTVFPNLSYSMKPDGCIWLSARPHPRDPDKCYFDMWYLTLFPEGATEYYSNSMHDWVSIDHQVEHQQGKYGEISCGPTIDQDIAIWTTQHKGMQSQGFRGAHLPTQEHRIQFFHDNLDRYLGIGD